MFWLDDKTSELLQHRFAAHVGRHEGFSHSERSTTIWLGFRLIQSWRIMIMTYCQVQILFIASTTIIHVLICTLLQANTVLTKPEVLAHTTMPIKGKKGILAFEVTHCAYECVMFDSFL